MKKKLTNLFALVLVVALLASTMAVPAAAAGTDTPSGSGTYLRTSLNPNNYVELSLSGSTLTVSGKLQVDGLSKLQAKCGSASASASVSSGSPFSLRLTLSHTGSASVNLYTYLGSSTTGWSITYNHIYIEKTAGGYRILPSLVQSNNTALEQVAIDPQRALNDRSNVPATVAALSDQIVGGETDDYAKVFLLYQWVTQNIYYDYDAYYGRSGYITDSAGVLQARRSVCEGYSRLLKDLILAQGIPAIHCTNSALASGSYALTTAAGEAHAHTEAYVNGRWITMDATWDSRNTYEYGVYTQKAPNGYYYFDISSEAFAMDHKILSRGGQYYITNSDDFRIRPSDGALVGYEGKGGAIVIPDNVTLIEAYAFQDCTTITSVVIPQGVTQIGTEAFRNCTNLTSVVIPESVTTFGTGVFSGCSSLKSANLPSRITAIPNSLFWGCGSLEHIDIPGGVTSIGDWAFYQCAGLDSISIPSGVTYIGFVAFRGCTGLTSVTIPGGVRLDEQTQGIFRNCTNLKQVTIGEGVTHIPTATFSCCTALTAVSIPASVTSIGYEAFVLTAPTDIYYGGTQAQWNAISVNRKNDPLKNAALHCGDTTIPAQPDTPTEQPEDPKDQPVPPTDQTTTDPRKFTDVPAGSYYADAVAWAVGKKITDGTSGTTFSPDLTCSNAHILTFLWRAAGKPEVSKGTCFDVPEDAYYAGACRWAGSMGMIYGPLMRPNQPCTRASAVLYLWKAAGSPTVTVTNKFTDVPANSSYAMAVAWALQKGVTKGTSGSTFSPDKTCTRAEIVAFLYRAFAGSDAMNGATAAEEMIWDSAYGWITRTDYDAIWNAQDHPVP